MDPPLCEMGYYLLNQLTADLPWNSPVRLAGSRTCTSTEWLLQECSGSCRPHGPKADGMQVSVNRRVGKHTGISTRHENHIQLTHVTTGTAPNTPGSESHARNSCCQAVRLNRQNRKTICSDRNQDSDCLVRGCAGNKRRGRARRRLVAP